MGKWLAEFQENTIETLIPSTDITDTSCELSVLSVPDQNVLKENQQNPPDRWNQELAAKGYVWCLDCQHFNGVNCNHTDNPFHTGTKCPQAPRKCQW